MPYVRLVNELRVAGITTVPAANRYLHERFLATYDARFTHAPADPASAFVPLGTVDLTHILCHEETRTVAPDNTVSLEGVRLQIDKQPGRRTCEGLRVLVRRHLDGGPASGLGRAASGTTTPPVGACPPRAPAPRPFRRRPPTVPRTRLAQSVLSPLRPRVRTRGSAKPRRRCPGARVTPSRLRSIHVSNPRRSIHLLTTPGKRVTDPRRDDATRRVGRW